MSEVGKAVGVSFCDVPRSPTPLVLVQNPRLLLADLISLEDAMEELELGPNGGLVYCMEYLLENMDWLKDELDKFDDEEYIIFDCPGQVVIVFRWAFLVLYTMLENCAF